MAQQLKKRGQKVLLVVMVDSPKPLLTEEEKVEYTNAVACEAMRWRGQLTNGNSDFSPIEIDFNPKIFEYNLQIPANHIPQIYSERVVYFAAQEKSKDSFISALSQPNAWNRWVVNGFEVCEVPGNHLSMTKEPNVGVLAEKLSNCLDRAECEESDGEQLIFKLSLNQELEEKGYRVIDFLGEDEVQSLLKLYGENSIPRDLLEPIVSATLCSSDLFYRQQATQGIKKILTSKLNFLFPNHRVAVCTFINKRADRFYGNIDLHQDRSFADETNLKTFGVWCPLVDVNEQNGCFYVVQKSHLLNSTPRSSNGFPYNQEILSMMRQDYLTTVLMKAGQALIYDNRLIHGSFPISTDTERLAVVCVLTPKDSPVLFYYRDSITSNKLEVFKVDDAFYDSYIQGEKPENAISLGAFDYQVAPITPEQLVEFMSESQPKVNKKTGIREKFLLFFNLLRGSDWWFYKIPPLLAIAYAEILLQTTSPQQSIVALLTLLASMFFVASYGHVINDIFDVEVDLQAGRQNRMASLSNPQCLVLCVTLAGLGLVPWLFIGFSTQSAILLAAIYILLTIYSAPPLRLKERDIWGVITDAAQVHAVPTLLVTTVFSHLADTPQPESAILATVATTWAFLAGVRGILLHQIWDRDSDLSAGVKTLTTRIGVESARSWITYISFPLELLLLTLLIIVIFQFAPLLLIFCTLYILLRIISTQAAVTALNPAPAQKAYILPHDFYEVWLPLALLILLVSRELVFLSLLAIHIGLFYPAIVQRVTEFNPFLLSALKGATSLVNLAQNDSHKGMVVNTQGNRAELRQQQTEQELEQIKFRLQQTQEDSEQLQCQLKQIYDRLAQSHTLQTELDRLQSDFQQSQKQSDYFQIQLQKTEQELAQFQSELQTSRTELAQIEFYLQQTQGIEGIMTYYCSRIAANPNDIQLYHQALKVKPDDAQIHLQLSNALIRQNRIEDAIAAYQTALQYHPDNFKIHLELGKALEKEQRWDEAILAYYRAIELKPDYSWSHKYLGDVLAERSQLNEASLSYRRALQLQPRIF